MKQSTAAVCSILSAAAAVILLIFVVINFVSLVTFHGTIDAVPIQEVYSVLIFTIAFLTALALMVLCMILGHESQPAQAAPNTSLQEPEAQDEHPEPFEQQLENEISFCKEHQADVSLLILTAQDDTGTMKQVINEYFRTSAYIYPLGINRYAVILPFYDSSTAVTEMSSCIRGAAPILREKGIICYGGMTSRNGRDIDADTFVYEAEVSLQRAVREEAPCIMCFEADKKQYEQAVHSLN